MTNEWINEEIENAEKMRDEAGQRKWIKFQEGTTKLEINLDVAPEQKVLTVRQEHVEGEMNYGLHPFMLEKLLKVLVNDGKTEGWVKVQVTRTGKLMETRYSFKAGWE